MRRTLTLCRSGITVAAAAVLLTACGGSDGSDSSSSSASTTSSSASEGSADAADSEFCTQAASIEERVGSTLTDQSDPRALPQAFQAIATEIRGIEPPEEIAADWNTFAGGLEQVAAAFGNIDFNDPNALATLQQQIAALESQLGPATTNVQQYLSEECGIDLGSESAAPTS